MASKQHPETVRIRGARAVSYRGQPFAPATGTYRSVSNKTLNLTTIADSGYAPSAVTRLAELGALGPLALAAVWEAAFALEAGPLSTWDN